MYDHYTTTIRSKSSLVVAMLYVIPIDAEKLKNELHKK